MTTYEFVQLALNIRTGERSAVRFMELENLDGPAVLRRLLSHRACGQHPNVIQLQVPFARRRQPHRRQRRLPRVRRQTLPPAHVSAQAWGVLRSRLWRNAVYFKRKTFHALPLHNVTL